MKITRVLTDNGKAFTDRLFGLRKRAATGQHEFDLLCADFGIEHRLAPPMRPQTNGMVERFNGRIEDILQSHRFHSGEDLEQTLLRYVHLYNSQLPQSVLKGRSPINALKDWQRQRPELFRKRVYNHAGCDTYALSNRSRNSIFAKHSLEEILFISLKIVPIRILLEVITKPTFPK